MPARSPRPRRSERLQARGRLDLSLTAPVEIRAQEGEAAPGKRFRIVAYTGEPMRLCMWDDPVVIDLDTLDLRAQRVPVLYDHHSDVDYVVGQTDSVRVENGTIVAEGPVIEPAAGDTQRRASRVLDLAAAGFVWQASVGGRAGSRDHVRAGETTVVNGREYAGPVSIARNASLHEISFVVNGADQFTQALVARRIRGSTMPSFDEYVMALGFDPAALSDQQKAALTLAYREKYPDGATDDAAGVAAEEPAADDEAPVAAAEEDDATPAPAAGVAARRRQAPQRLDVAARMRQEAARELGRQSAVREICAAYPDGLQVEVNEGGQRRRVQLLEHAIAAGLSREQTELLALRASRPAPSIIVRSHDRDCTREALEGALLLRCGGRLDHPAYQTPRAVGLVPAWLRAGLNDASRNQLMEAAHRFADTSLLDICAEACRLDGREAPRGRNEVIRAAVSGSALTNIFTTNVNAMLLASYQEVGDTTVGWTSETEVADFRSQERVRVEVGPGLVKLPRGGEADHAKFSDKSESYKIARYARQFVVDEQDIIDDWLGAISDTPQQFGRAAAWLRPDLVYSILKANASLGATSTALFHADQDQGTGLGNLDTSVALNATNLKAGIARMSLFVENGRNLNLRATHLIVPPTLEWTALELMQSATVVIAGTAGSVTERGSANTLQSRAQVVAEARLENGVTDPSSETAYSGSSAYWFLACNYAHTIEVAYLRGTGRAPQVRSFVLDKGKYGIGWDIKMDIGAKALDWKGLYQGQG